MRTQKAPAKNSKRISPLVLLNEIDRSLVLVLGVFLTFGLLIIYDATAVLSQELYGFAYRFVLLQFGWILVGSLGFYFFASLSKETLIKLATPIFIVTVLTLFLLALFGILPCDLSIIFAPCINGANRWFYLNPDPLPSLPVLGVLGFQPSELGKFALILFLSALLNKNVSKDAFNNFFGYLFVTGIVAFLVLLQPNLSTMLLLSAIGTAIYFSSGSELKPLFMLIPVAFFAVVFLMVYSPYRRDRLMTFISGGSSGAESLETGYHIRQILIALGSGGVTGVGLGQSRQKFQYLPEVFADSIFAIIGEQFGFIGTTILILGFAFLIYKGFTIAKNSNDLFFRLLAVGVTTWIALQFFVNVAAMTRLIPLTGIPLPLISYGGSSLVFMLMGLGLLANVSRKSSS